MEKFIVTHIISNLSQNTKGIVSDCMSISFRNQGSSTVSVSPDTSGGSVIILLPGEERNYSLTSPYMSYQAKYDIEFKENGSHNLLIEKEYAEKINLSC